MADEFEYLSQARSEFRHGYRHAYLSEVVRPVVVSTLDQIVAAAGG